MTRRPLVSSRRAPIAVLGVLVVVIALAAIGLGRADAAVGPDVVVFSFTDIGNYTAADGYCAYAVGTRSCNRGDVPLNWCDQGSGCAPGATSEDHPVIAQNLYRLKNGRFEQIGQSWLKHGFYALSEGLCSPACEPTDGEHLGVIEVPENTGNLAWGGPEWKTLFIPSSTSLYRIETKVASAPLPYH